MQRGSSNPGDGPATSAGSWRGDQAQGGRQVVEGGAVVCGEVENSRGKFLRGGSN